MSHERRSGAHEGSSEAPLLLQHATKPSTLHRGARLHPAQSIQSDASKRPSQAQATTYPSGADSLRQLRMADLERVKMRQLHISAAYLSCISPLFRYLSTEELLSSL